MNLKLNTSPNAKIIFSILLVVVMVAASIMYVVIPQNERRIEISADIKSTQLEINSLRNQIPDMAELASVKSELENTLSELQKNMEQELQSPTNLKRNGNIDTSVSNLTALLGGMAEALSIDTSKFEVVQDNPNGTEYDIFLYGSYHDISTFFQALHALDVTYEIRQMFLQPVILDENTGTPIPVPGATTPYIPTYNVNLPSGPLMHNMEPNPTQDMGTSASNTTSAPTNPGQYWTFGEGTDILQETPLFDPVTGQVLESVYDMTLQVSFKMFVTKNANGIPVDVAQNRNITPNNPFSEDRTVKPNGRFGYKFDYMGEGTHGTGSFDEKLTRLIKDREFRKNEIVRTRAVIDNRKNAGLSIDDQIAYFNLLVNIDVEVERGKYVDRTKILQDFVIPTDEPVQSDVSEPQPDKDSPESDETDVEEQQPSGNRDGLKTLKLGDTARVNDLLITLHSIQTSNDGKSNTPNGDHFLILDVTLENAGNETETVSTILQMFLYDAYSYEYSQTFLEDTTGTLDGDIDPGRKRRGKIAFDVPITRYYEFVFRDPITKEQAVWKF